MSEVVSFGNIVNSLRSVRNDYNEHLKAVPQYEAFLLVESSTQSVADKLQGVAPAMAMEVVEALEIAKAKLRQHLTSVPEYRALLAIDKLINDVAADLGVLPAAPALIDVRAVVTDTTSAPVQVEQPAAKQQTIAEAAQAPSEQSEAVAQPQADTVEVTSAPVHVVAQAEVQPELTTADAPSQFQIALQTAEALPEVTPVAEAAAEPIKAALPPLTEPGSEVGSASPIPLPVQEYGREAEKAA